MEWKIMNFYLKVFLFFTHKIICYSKENIILFVLQQFKKIIKNLSFQSVSILHSWNNYVLKMHSFNATWVFHMFIYWYHWMEISQNSYIAVSFQEMSFLLFTWFPCKFTVVICVCMCVHMCVCGNMKGIVIFNHGTWLGID